MMRKMVIALFLVIVASPVLLAGEEEAVVAAERAWAAATVANDYAALENILADDLYYSHSNFLEDTKRSFIDNLKSGKARYFAIDIDTVKARLLDEKTALAMAVSRFETKAPDGSRQKVTLKTLHVFTKNQGKWQLTAHQSAKKPE